VSGFVIQGQVTALSPSDGNLYTLSLSSCDNQGTIHVERNTSLDASDFKNEGTVTADSGAIFAMVADLGGAFHNAGTINATNTEVDLGGDFKPSDIGTIHLSGGSIHMRGTMENAGNTYVINSANSPWFLDDNPYFGFNGQVVGIKA
jgi:hypothetical protein